MKERERWERERGGKQQKNALSLSFSINLSVLCSLCVISERVALQTFRFILTSDEEVQKKRRKRGGLDSFLLRQPCMRYCGWDSMEQTTERERERERCIYIYVCVSFGGGYVRQSTDETRLA
jgi:hypothetical protein